MDISITRHYHRHEFKINFHRDTMIGANSLRRRFNYFRRDAISESRWSKRSRRSPHWVLIFCLPASSSLVASFFTSLLYSFFFSRSFSLLRITLYFQISGQSSSSIGILRCISGFAVDDTSRPWKEMTKRIPEFYYPFRSPLLESLPVIVCLPMKATD